MSDILLRALSRFEAPDSFVSCFGNAEPKSVTYDTCFSVLQEAVPSSNHHLNRATRDVLSFSKTEKSQRTTDLYKFLPVALKAAEFNRQRVRGKLLRRFHDYDENKDQVLDLDEFDKLVSSLESSMSRREKVELFLEIQQDSDNGVITPEVWVAAALR